jgi:hypothetical protein
MGGMPPMGRSEEYRRFAAECLTMANDTEDEQTRAIYLQMAQVWFRLSAERGDDNEPENRPRRYGSR